MAAKGKGKGNETVMVVVRMRPFNRKEKDENRGPCIEMDRDLGQIAIRNPARPEVSPRPFTFDAVFGEDTQQKIFYEESCYQLVESVMEGFNGTIFAYGQTGCGKTFTMQGMAEPPEMRGVIPCSFDQIFQNVTADPETQYLVRCAYLEIYNEEIRDLLGADSKAKLDLKEDPQKGVHVKDLKQVVVQDVESINAVMDAGFEKRTVGATLMNAGSSRSHSIFTVIIEASDQQDGRERLRAGKLNLVDLAGSERQGKTGATGDRLKEGCKINLSLSALGNVISALVDGKGKHIPYRDSKLTRLLQDSLGGNTKTLMVAAISPADYNYDETLSTLRYANRAKNIKNKPKINEDPKDAMLREYKEEIERLKALLEMHTNGALAGMSPDALAALVSGGGGGGGRAEGEGGSRGQESEQPEGAAVDKPTAAAASVSMAHQSDLEDAPPGMAGDDLASTASTAREPLPPGVAVRAEDAVGRSPANEEEGEEEEDGPPGMTQQASPADEDGAPPGLGSGLDEEKSEEEDGPPGLGQDGPPGMEDDAHDPDPASPLSLPGGADTGGPPGMQPGDEDEPPPGMAPQAVAVPPARAKPVMVEVERVVEVLPKQLESRQRAMEEYHRSVVEQRNLLGEQLQKQDGLLRQKADNAEQLQRKLELLKEQLMGGQISSKAKDGDDAIQVELAKKERERRRMQAKLRAKKRKEAQLQAEREQAEQEKREAQEELRFAQEQAETEGKKVSKLRKRMERKIADARMEVEDLTAEFQQEKDDLLSSIREQNRDLKLLEQVVDLILPKQQVAKMWERSVWNEELQEWSLPQLKPRREFANLNHLPALTVPGVTGTGSASDSERQRKREKRRERDKQRDEEHAMERAERAMDKGLEKALERERRKAGAVPQSDVENHLAGSGGGGGSGSSRNDPVDPNGGLDSTRGQQGSRGDKGSGRRSKSRSGSRSSRGGSAARQRSNQEPDSSAAAAALQGEPAGGELFSDWGFAAEHGEAVARPDPRMCPPGKRFLGEEYGDRCSSRQGGDREHHRRSKLDAFEQQQQRTSGSRSRPSSGRVRPASASRRKGSAPKPVVPADFEGGAVVMPSSSGSSKRPPLVPSLAVKAATNGEFEELSARRDVR